MKKLTFSVVLLLCLGVAGYAIYSYGVLTPGATVAPAMKSVYAAHRVRILAHVFCSVVALVTGPFQFLPAVRERRAIHRKIGYAYFSAVLFGGVTGLAMAFVAYGGLVSKLGFAVLALLWLYTGYRALLAVWERDYEDHRMWAIRCFALTFAAVTLRIYLGVFFALGLPFDSFYPALGWLCWVPNLLLVEWIILRPKKEPNQTPEPTAAAGRGSS